MAENLKRIEQTTRTFGKDFLKKIDDRKKRETELVQGLSQENSRSQSAARVQQREIVPEIGSDEDR
jgi:hypothetical protein